MDLVGWVATDALWAYLAGIREIFSAAGGTHDDWDAYDEAMREERRTAVFVARTGVYSNPT